MGNKISITSRRLGRIVEDSASEIYIFAGDDFKFSLVNRGARENLGYTMPEMEGLTPWDIKPEVDRDEFLAMVGPLIRNEKDRSISRLFISVRTARTTTSLLDCN